MRLYFQHDAPTVGAVPEFYSHLPIIVDYSSPILWDATALRRMKSALRFPDRVVGISIKGSYRNVVKVSNALDLSFPALESLGLQEMDSFRPDILLTMPFKTSIRSLRRLQLDGASPISSEILSVTTSLIDLTLNTTILTCLMSIFPHLQRMPHLRNLEVSSRVVLPLHDEMPHTMATLPELTHFRISDGCSDIEWLVAGLVSPSLLELDILLYDEEDDESRTRILGPNLSEFIRAAGIVFFAARLSILPHTFKTSLYARPLSINGPPSKIVTIETVSLARPHIASSPMLATVEDIFLSLPDPTESNISLLQNPLREFFNEFRNVKVLRLHHDLETIAADMLGQPTANPLPAGEELDPDATTRTSQVTLDIFPSLEEIVVHARTPDMSIDGMESASLLGSFGPFVAARDQVGRPVKVFRDADGKVPDYFTMDSQTSRMD